MEQSDHDLIIELRVDVKAMRGDMLDLKDSFRGTIKDHEDRLRAIEPIVEQARKDSKTTAMLQKGFWTAVGALYIIDAIIGLYIIYKK